MIEVMITFTTVFDNKEYTTIKMMDRKKLATYKKYIGNTVAFKDMTVKVINVEERNAKITSKSFS
jgi:hypothetical protein